MKSEMEATIKVNTHIKIMTKLMSYKIYEAYIMLIGPKDRLNPNI